MQDTAVEELMFDKKKREHSSEVVHLRLWSRELTLMGAETMSLPSKPWSKDSQSMVHKSRNRSVLLDTQGLFTSCALLS
jgi:hypothetical protein